MSVTVNTGTATPPGVAGTQGENQKGDVTNVIIYPNGVPLDACVPHGNSSNGHPPAGHPRPKYAGPLWFFLLILLALLIWSVMGWPTIQVGSGPAPSSTSTTASAVIQTNEPALEPQEPVVVDDVALDPLPAPSYTREVPVHKGTNVFCEVTLSGPHAILGDDEAVMSFVATNKDSLCISATGSAEWEREIISWERR